jgi:restriction system protein
MKTYSDVQIDSVGILIFFISILLFYGLHFMFRSKPKRYLRRYRTVKKLKKLSWSEFEHLCLVLFREQGWKVKGNEQRGADGGVDLWMQKRRTHAIVQCKKYEDAKVTVKVVREMYGLMHEYGVDHAFVVTTSGFTKECDRFVKEKKMTLIDGETLVALIRKVTR